MIAGCRCYLASSATLVHQSRSDLTTAEVSRPSGKHRSRGPVVAGNKKTAKRHTTRDSFFWESEINDINIVFLKTLYVTREISTVWKSEKRTEHAASEQGGSGLLYSDQIRRDRARLRLSHVHMSMTKSKSALPRGLVAACETNSRVTSLPGYSIATLSSSFSVGHDPRPL